MSAAGPAAESAESESRRILVQIPMRWGDMDAYGHINNVQVVR
ncbi:MAG TPA: acyl-CoA thioesterase, partial [Arthrobacter sp.]|nr:acyl-CoA thioesterase [Arthrobacter sp.]